MNTKHIFSLMTLFCMTLVAQSQNIYEELKLKQGNICRGYISSQNMQTGEIEFEAVLQTATMDSQLVNGKIVERKNLNDIPEAARKWLEENPRYIKHEGNNSFVELTKLETIHIGTTGWSIIVEDGSIIKYVVLDKVTKTFKSSDVEAIKRFERPEDQATGLCDVIVVEGKEYVGQILEKRIGKEIRLLKDDGIIQVISNKKIQSTGKKPLYANRSLMEQSPYIETVFTKSGQELRGLITKEEYKTENGKYETTLYVTTEKGQVESVNYKDVTCVKREVNPNYKTEKYKVVENDEFIVCGLTTPKCISKRLKDEIQYIYEKDENFDFCQIVKSEFSELTIDMEDTSANRNIILIPITITKHKGYEYYTFTDGDLLHKEIEPSSTTTLRGVKTLHYTMQNAGFYLIYRKSDKRMHLIEVLKD